MRLPDFLLSFCISTAIHLGVFILGVSLLSHSQRDAEVIFEKGEQVITVNLVPFEASEPSSSSTTGTSLGSTEETASKTDPGQAQTRSDPQQVTTKMEVKLQGPVDKDLKSSTLAVKANSPSLDLSKAKVKEKPRRDHQKKSILLSSKPPAKPISVDDSSQGEVEQKESSKQDPEDHGGADIETLKSENPYNVGEDINAVNSEIPNGKGGSIGSISSGNSGDQHSSPEVGDSRKGGGKGGSRVSLNLGNADGSFKDKGVMVSATIVGLTKPKYPTYSRMHGEEGRVVLSVEIYENGERGKIEIVSSSGHSRLDQAAVQALEKARFIPAKIDGKAIFSIKRIAFTFRLEDAKD